MKNRIIVSISWMLVNHVFIQSISYLSIVLLSEQYFSKLLCSRIHLIKFWQFFYYLELGNNDRIRFNIQTKFLRNSIIFLKRHIYIIFTFIHELVTRREPDLEKDERHWNLMHLIFIGRRHTTRISVILILLTAI